MTFWNTMIPSLWVICFFVLSGCATSPKTETKKKGPSPQELLAFACDLGKDIESSQGTVLIKTNSKEVSGQFPASVNAIHPDKLRLEVTNFLGGTEALITVEGNRYELRGNQNQTERSEVGFGSWGGIPLRWATELFLGKFPCPPSADKQEVSLDAKGDLVVFIPSSANGDQQKFVYHFGEEEGKPWPESLHWERQGATLLSVDFKFGDPDDQTLSPKRWEANSSRGTVKVRWRDRNVSKMVKASSS